MISFGNKKPVSSLFKDETGLNNDGGAGTRTLHFHEDVDYSFI